MSGLPKFQVLQKQWFPVSNSHATKTISISNIFIEKETESNILLPFSNDMSLWE